MAFKARESWGPEQLLAMLPVVALCCALLAASPAKALELKEIRFWSLGDVTRVVIQFDGDFKYKYARLENPPRVFFDLPDAMLSIDGIKERGRMRRIEVNDAVLKQIRYAENSPGSSRVVLDLAGDHEFTASQLANPPRLIIEIRRPAKPDGMVEISRTGVVNPSANEANAPAASSTEPVSAVQALPESNPAPTPVASKIRAVEPSPSVPPRKPVPLDGVTPAARAERTAAVSETATVTAAVSPKPVAKPAARTATGQQSLTRALGLKIGKVAIDPGHGGKDQGTTGGNGLLEKDLVLDLAKRVKALVEENLGSEVILTREDDEFVSLEERTAIANRSRADLFVSLHANSSPFRLASGPETFYLDFTSSRESMDIAARENASSTRSVADLQDIVKKIALKDKRDESRDFAAKMQRSLFKAEQGKGSTKKRNRGVKAAPFIVLIGAEMPSILVEIGFLSNKQEESALNRDDHRQSVAKAIYEGLSSYIESLSHFEATERAARE